jgi:hypothetical protein
MGLLDNLPSEWLDIFKNSALNQNVNAGIGVDATNNPAPASLPQQPPLSLAGPRFSAGGGDAAPNGTPGAPPGLAPPPAALTPAQPSAPGIGDRLSAGLQSWARTPAGNPLLGLANGIQGLSTGQRADPEGQRQALFAQATPPSGGTPGGIDYDKLQRSLLVSGDLDGAKTVADISGKTSTDLIRNFTYARSQGFPGSILDYGKAVKAGATMVGADPNLKRAPMPAAGSIQSGWRFKNGNPADRNNWEQLQ